MAVRNRETQKELIFYADRGAQECAECFGAVLRETCPFVWQSMSRKGNCGDNAYAESFFKTLKSELETLDGKHAVAEVRQLIFFTLRRIIIVFAFIWLLTMLRLICMVMLLNGV